MHDPLAGLAARWWKRTGPAPLLHAVRKPDVAELAGHIVSLRVVVVEIAVEAARRVDVEHVVHPEGLPQSGF